MVQKRTTRLGVVRFACLRDPQWLDYLNGGREKGVDPVPVLFSGYLTIFGTR